jgi:paraquat-inducible protein A
MRFLLPATLLLATVSFTLGITLPLVRVERFLILSDEPSLVRIVLDLWNARQGGLACVILVFSILVPGLKLFLLHAAAYAGANGGLPTWFHALSKWSMLDVLLVALVIFAAKTSGLATAFAQPGLWFFAGSVVLTVAAAALVRKEGGQR